MLDKEIEVNDGRAIVNLNTLRLLKVPLYTESIITCRLKTERRQGTDIYVVVYMFLYRSVGGRGSA